MNNKNKNAGLAILEILLLVVIISFIAAISFVVLQHAKDKTPKVITKEGQADYIEIKEWHVNLTIPDSLQKISYKPVDDHLDNIMLSSEALDKFAAEHKECNGANQFIYISRTKVGAPLNGVPWDQAKIPLEQKGSKNLGLYYYYDGVRPSVSPCIGTNIAEIQKLNNEAYDLYDKLPTYKNIVINP